MKLNILQNNGIDLMNNQKYTEALEKFHLIINQNSDYEHGMIYYDMASCYEDLGELESAEKYYLKSLSFDSNDFVRVSGYASFLYQYRDSKKAYSWYLRVLKLELERGYTGIENTIVGLQLLGKKLIYSKNKIEQDIKKCYLLAGKKS